jgi:hypothetical protein
LENGVILNSRCENPNIVQDETSTGGISHEYLDRFHIGKSFNFDVCISVLGFAAQKVFLSPVFHNLTARYPVFPAIRNRR